MQQYDCNVCSAPLSAFILHSCFHCTQLQLPFHYVRLSDHRAVQVFATLHPTLSIRFNTIYLFSGLLLAQLSTMHITPQLCSVSLSNHSVIPTAESLNV